MICGTGPTRFRTQIAELSNKFAGGKDDYPEDMTSAYSLLLVCNKPSENTVNRHRHTVSGTTHSVPAPQATAMAFAQRGMTGPGGNNGMRHNGVQ